MGRLFWKILAGFWLALIAAAIGVGIGVTLEQQARFDERMAQFEAAPLAAGRYTRVRIEEIAALLRRHPQATARIRGTRRAIRRPVSRSGPTTDLLGREVPPRLSHRPARKRKLPPAPTARAGATTRTTEATSPERRQLVTLADGSSTC